MKYCTRCLYPETKPDLHFNEAGVCSACTAFEARKTIDWNKRENEFQLLVRTMKKQSSGHKYDCIVPVSGGKDSHFQVIKCLEYGLNVLAVTATTDDLTPLGRRNLDNISKLGVDHIEVTPNKKVRKRINKYTLETVGDISWAEHISIFTIPFRVAQEKGIGFIIWGENPQNEYGSQLEAQSATRLDKRWLSEFGGLNGLRIQDLVMKKILTYGEADIYRFPALPDDDIHGLFLGNYFSWDGFENARIAKAHGFELCNLPVEGCGAAYENLDNYQTGIHDLFKYLKYGFGRATDIANNQLRRERFTRVEAKEFIFTFDGKYNDVYLRMPFEYTLSRIDVNMEKFNKIRKDFANPELFDDQLKPKFLDDLKNA